MGGILGITGTPGTGKKTVAPVVARGLGVGCVSLNEIARDRGVVGKGAQEGDVDPRELRRWVARDVSPPALVYGHLLPYVLPPRSVARVVVLRCEPGVLKERLTRRGYPPGKVTQNVEAELIGVVSADAYERFGPGKTAEADTSAAKPGETAKEVEALLRGPRRGRGRIDWTLGYGSGAELRSLLSGR